MFCQLWYYVHSRRVFPYSADYEISLANWPVKSYIFIPSCPYHIPTLIVMLSHSFLTLRILVIVQRLRVTFQPPLIYCHRITFLMSLVWWLLHKHTYLVQRCETVKKATSSSPVRFSNDDFYYQLNLSMRICCNIERHNVQV